MTGIAASALGATIVSGTSSVTSNSNQSNGINFELFSQPNGGRLLAVLLVSIGLWAIFTLIVGGAVRLGYARFNLNLADGKDAAFSDLFSQKDRLWDGFCMKFLQGLYIALWSLLLVIPGIVKTCSRFCFPVRKLASWIADFAFDGSGGKVNNNFVTDLVINSLFRRNVNNFILLLFIQFPDIGQPFNPEDGLSAVGQVHVLQADGFEHEVDVIHTEIPAI